jgi:NAD(P)H dehydrogenase (quinone)
MTTTKARVLVMGATGQVGGALVALLRNEPAIELVAGVRDLGKGQRLQVPLVHLDLDRIETLSPALEGIDRVFMATGYTVDMLRQSKDFLNAARRAGVTQIVHLGACGDDDTHVAHYGWHQFVERYIEWAGFTFTHLRPEIFMQNLLGYGGERVIERGVLRHYVGAARMSWVDCDDVAAVAAVCLLNPAEHAGRTYRMGYEARTYDDIAHLLSQVLGQPFRYEPRPPDEFLRNVLAAGADPAYMQCVFDSYSALTTGQRERADEVFDNFPALVGRPPRTLVDFITRHADRFRDSRTPPGSVGSRVVESRQRTTA